ncbi:cyclic AMP-responsive element-binding protein 3-like protein 3-A isoform X1 [Lepisosteus oculatus]|uniref:cyclic AMP-responsive element-binding protein 3-like protein 3-A isoform X1 n=2 Tax=Lepisosteus oculatus TaxID=7918 RepID=UPI003722CDFA
MTLEAEKAYDGMELLDLLFDQNDGILRHEGFGQHNCPSWPTTEHSLLSPAEGSDEFLSALLGGSDSVSGSPLWSPAASDSGISEDPQSDQLDSPPPCRPPDSPHLKPPYPPVAPTSQHPPPALPLDSQEPDVSIDLGGWESGFFVERPSNGSHLGEDQKAHGVQRIQMLSSFPLTVKDLLLSSSSEPPQQQSQQPFQELVLNEDEKKLLAKEGVSLPSQLPLTKYEERILKKIRRKIRNKQSAQESRKKKKEYIDGLESRMAACSAQNQELQRKVFQLEKRNSSLMEQLRRLQTLVMSSSNKTAQTGTCIMVLLLSFSLILFPCLRPFSSSTVSQEGDFSPVRVQSRSLHNVESSRVSHAVAHDRAHSAPEPGGAAPGPSGEEEGKMMPPFGKLSQGSGLPFADFASTHINHTHDVEERGHHQGDPITGHVATVSWTEHHGGKTPLPNHADEM